MAIEKVITWLITQLSASSKMTLDLLTVCLSHRVHTDMTSAALSYNFNFKTEGKRDCMRFSYENVCLFLNEQYDSLTVTE